MMRSKTSLGYSAASAPFGTVPRRRESIPTGAGCTGRTPAGPAPAVHTPPRWSLRAIARWACVLCALAAAPLAPAHARELIGNLEQPIGTGYNYTSSTLHITQGFTTGSNAATLTSIDFSIAQAYTAGSPGQYVTPTVTLRRGRAQGPVVATLTGATPLTRESGPVRTYSAPANTTLAASTTYFVVVEFPGRTTNVDVRLSLGNSEDCGGISDWSIADSSFNWNSSQPIPFEDLGEYLIAVNGTLMGGAPPSTQVCEPQSLGATPGSRQVALTWAAPAGAGESAITKYQYRFAQGGTVSETATWRDVADGGDAGGSAGDERDVVVTGLTNGRQYAFEVRAVNSQGPGPKAGPVTATPSNTAPTGADRTVTTIEDDTPYTFSAADFVFTDVDSGDKLESVKLVTLPGSGSLTLSGDALSANDTVTTAQLDSGSLTFTPAANGSGDPYTSFTFQVSDGTAESDDPYTMTIDVTPVNDAPTARNLKLIINEDRVHDFRATSFGFSDIDRGDRLASVRIVTLPADGSLTLSGDLVSANDTVMKDRLDDGSLTFTPAANAYSEPYTSFTFKVSDGTAESADAYTMTIDVWPVNDAPTSADRTVTIDEDTDYTFSANEFSFSDIDTGDALVRVRIVTLPGAGTLAAGGTPVTPGQLVAADDLGNLTYTPNENGNGAPYTTFTFQVSDGDADIGLAYSVLAYTMTVDVTPVSDAPTASDNTVTTNEDTAHTFSAADFVFTDVDEGDMLASVTVVTLPGAGALAAGGTPVTAGQSVAADDIGNLTFTPATDASGAPICDLHLPGQRRHGGQCPGLHDDGRRDAGERRPDGCGQDGSDRGGHRTHLLRGRLRLHRRR